MTNTIQTLDASLQCLITTVVAGAEKAGGFVAEEAPIVIEQLLAWRFTISLILFVAMLLLVPCITIICKAVAHRLLLVEWMVIFAILGLLVAIGVPATQSCNLVGPFEWLQIAIAPKLYLLEYAADLIK